VAHSADFVVRATLFWCFELLSYVGLSYPKLVVTAFSAFVSVKFYKWGKWHWLYLAANGCKTYLNLNLNWPSLCLA
jgi:hypothetical protein